MKTKIEWCDYTFNPWIGCSKVSAGCANCYAEGIAKRFKLAEWGKSADRILSSDKYFQLPLQWDRKAKKNKTRYKVFCASMADVFDETVSDKWRVKLFHLMEKTKNLDWLLLTKRAKNAKRFMDVWNYSPVQVERNKNVWIGVSVENQSEADERIPVLLQIPAEKRFLSIEPLLEKIDLTNLPVPLDIDQRGFHISCLQRSDDRFYNVHPVIDWVIVGGESGSKARPMHPEWVRSIRDQCIAAGVPFFFKQWGEYYPYQVTYGMKSTPYKYEGGKSLAFKLGKKKSGRVLDGREWNEFPKNANEEDAK